MIWTLKWGEVCFKFTYKIQWPHKVTWRIGETVLAGSWADNLFPSRKNSKCKNPGKQEETEHCEMDCFWVLGEWIRQVIVGEADFVEPHMLCIQV